MPLVGHRLKRFTQELNAVRFDAQLAGLGDKERPGKTEKITQIDGLFPDFIVPISGR